MTVWALPSSSATTAEPIRPVPPVTKTRMELSRRVMGLLSHHSNRVMGQKSHDPMMVTMGRWEPGARERLVVAAVDLFTEQGYDATTVAQIAERAGVTKSTFFRHFPDKRELLVAGQETLSRLLTEGIAEAPAGASPLAGGAPRGPGGGAPAPRGPPRSRASLERDDPGEPGAGAAPDRRRGRQRRAA